MIKTYYYLAKPGIIYGNDITAAAGFFLASRGHISFWLLLAMLAGISLVMGAAGVVNNIFDRDIDGRMDRTKKRALVTGAVSTRSALAYGLALAIAGFAVLWCFTNPITTLVAFIGLSVYVGIYSPLKRKTVQATLIGSIAGATPPVVGYCAVTGRFDLAAFILFLILTLWQMPHFYSIAIYRLKDYAAASIPVLPVKKGILHTKYQIIAYIIIFVVSTLSLAFYGYAGKIYFSIALALGLIWLFLGLGGFKKGIDDTLWAKKMFKFSLIVLTFISITISIGGIMYK